MIAKCPDCGGPLVEVNREGAFWYCPALIGIVEFNKVWRYHWRPEGDVHRPSAVTGGYKAHEVVPYEVKRRVA